MRSQARTVMQQGLRPDSCCRSRCSPGARHTTATQRSHLAVSADVSIVSSMRAVGQGRPGSRTEISGQQGGQKAGMAGCGGRKKPCCMPLAASCLQAQLCSEFPGHGPAPTCVRHTLHKVALSFRVFRNHLLPFLLLFLLPLDWCCCCSSRLGLLLAILPCSCRRRLRWRRVATMLLLS